MSNKTLFVLAALAAAAFATNPDEDSFRKHVDQSLKKQGSGWFERKLVSHVSTLVYRRRDYKFFSVVNIPDEELNYIGIFGFWFALPTFKSMRDNATL